MKLVCVATHSERYYPYLKLSAERNNFDLVTLGWGEKWKGFGWRFELMRKYLKSLKTDEIICFIDGYDVIILEDIKTLEQKFISQINGDKSKIILAVESETDSNIGNFIIKVWSNFFSYKCDNKLINAGTYVGYSSTLLNVFDSMCREFECKSDSDDQIILQRYCATNLNKFIFDTNSNIFLTMGDPIKPIIPNTNYIKIENKTLIYKSTITPSIFHAPAYSDIDDIVKGLDYDTSIFKARNESKLNYQIGFAKHFIKEIFLRYWTYIIFIVIFILYIILNYKYNLNNKLYRYLKRQIRLN
jgi:hypothetical protein